MVVCKRDAHLALNQLSDYRNRLDSQKDGLLVEALNRLMNVFQSRLFLSLLDIQEFYEAILLDPQKTKEEKTSAALEIASRWENISSPSLVASTTDLRIPHSLMNKTNNFDRARSMYHINIDDSQNPRLPQPMQSSSPNYRRHLPPHDDDYHYHHPHLSNLNKSWKHMEPDQQRFDYATSISLNNMNQPSSVENVSNVHLTKKHNNNNNSHNSDFNPEHPLYTHDKPSQNEHEASKKQPPSTIPVAKPRQKRLKRLKSSQIHHLEEESISINTDENAYFNNNNNNQFPVPQNNSQDNLLNDDDNELNDRQWALLSRLPVTMEVIIDKSPKGFGFSIAGGHDNTIGSNDDDTDIYVTRVNPGGPADYESGLQLGDRILSVNGISLIGATHSEAVKALQLAGNRLKLIVERKAELAISEQDSLVSFSSSYSHSKPPMNPSFSKHITKLKTPSAFHHSSPSNELFPAAQNIESIMSTGTGTGTGGSGDGGGKSGGSGVSLTTTTNSLISGSLFDHRDSKQTLNSTTTTTSTKNRSPHKATITTTHHGGSPPSIPGVITQEKFHKSSDTVQSLNDYNADVIQKNQKDGQFSSSRLSRRGVACAGFPAFSWCGGLQRVTAGCASLGRGHHSLQGSSKNSSRQKLPGSAEQQQTAFRSHELTSTIGARPTPPPKPGPFVVEVILTRGTRSGLGFSITGGVGNEASNGDSGIFVTKITSGGVAETDGRIRIGDRIVQVNDIPLVDVTHEQAVRVLKQAGDQVKLVIVKQVSHSSRHASSTGETKIPSNDLNNQSVLPPNPDFGGSGDFHRNAIADEYCVKSSTPASLSSFHRSPSLSPTPSSHSASPALEASVHTAPSRKSSSGQIVRSGDSKEQQEEEENLQQQAATGTSKSLQSKHRHSLNYNHQSQLHSNDLSKTAKKNSYTSSMANNENYRSSPDLSNDRFHKPTFYGSTGTNIPCFASTGQELLENRMVGIIDYAAAASVSNLLSEWPDARLVTLYRSGRKRVSSIHRDKVDPNDTFRRGFSSGGVGVGSLGLNIVGGDGSEATFISHIQPDKPAGQSKRIFVGDRLLTVNGVDVTRFGHEKAAAALRDARDRVDLLLAYRPEEYAEFEKHFCRQLKAVGHKLSYKCLHSLRAENNINDDDNDGIEKDAGVRADESPRKSNEAGKDKAKRKTTDEPSDKTKQGQQHQQQQKRQVKKKSKASKKQLGEEEVLTKGQTDDMITYPNVLLLRCQVDYDPAKENHHQTIPKKVFSLRSGDLVYVINTVDSEWWQAQKFDPATNEPVGPIGLIPSRLRLERKERTRTLHVNFMARNSRSVDSPSVKSNDAYERRKIKSIKPSTSSYSLVEGVSHLKNAKIFKERTEDRDASHSSKGKSCRDSSRRRYHHRRRSSDQRHRPLSYIAVTPVHLSFARPVVILGYMKDRIGDELLCEFPDLFGTAVPYTTRQRRPNEVEGRDYHFVISKEIMVADIAAQKYLEAGEYNGNLYGTHLDSVFEVSELGLHCLLDVGGPALKRLESAGLPPIAILVLPETLSPTDKNDVHDDVGDNGGDNNNNNNNNEQSPNANEQGKNNKSKLQKRTSVESEALKNLQVKLGRLLQHFTSFLTAIVTTDDYNVAYNRVKEIIFNNAGPIVWLNSPQPIP